MTIQPNKLNRPSRGGGSGASSKKTTEAVVSVPLSWKTPDGAGITLEKNQSTQIILVQNSQVVVPNPVALENQRAAIQATSQGFDFPCQVVEQIVLSELLDNAAQKRPDLISPEVQKVIRDLANDPNRKALAHGKANSKTFAAAVAKGDLNGMTIHRPENINEPYDNGWLPTSHAIRHGTFSGLLFVLNCPGLRIDLQHPPANWNALIAAFYEGDLHKEYAVLSLKPKPNFVNDDGHSGLLMTGIRKHPDSLDRLLEYKQTEAGRELDLNVQDPKTLNTALHFFAEIGYTHSCRALVSACARRDLLNKQEMTASELARRAGWLELAKELKS